MSNLITTTTAFNVETISVGDLISIFDENAVFIGSGIILDVKPMTLEIALYSEGVNNLYTRDFGEFEKLSPWRLHIEQVETNQYRVAIIDPKMVELGV